MPAVAVAHTVEMSTNKLCSMVSCTGVAIGDTVTLPHGLILNGVAVVPDLVFLQYATSFELVAATNVSITLRNTANDELHRVRLGHPPCDSVAGAGA